MTGGRAAIGLLDGTLRGPLLCGLLGGWLGAELDGFAIWRFDGRCPTVALSAAKAGGGNSGTGTGGRDDICCAWFPLGRTAASRLLAIGNLSSVIFTVGATRGSAVPMRPPQ